MGSITITAKIGPGLEATATTINDISNINFDLSNLTLAIKTGINSPIYDISNVSGISFDISNGNYNINVNGNDGGNGVNYIRQAMILLTNDDILTSPTIPIEVVPATEILDYSGYPTQLPVISQVIPTWKVYEGTPYGDIEGGGYLGIFYGSDAGAGPIAVIVKATDFLDGSFLPFYQSPGGVLIQDDALFSQKVFSGKTNLLDGIKDNGLFFAASNLPTGNYSGGHTDDILAITVEYRLLDTSTNLYIPT